MQEEYLQKIERTVLSLNQNGLSYLYQQQHASEAFDYFKKAEKMILTETSKETKRRQQLLAITYNNLAIYYKKTNKPKAALTYLKKALELEALELSDWLASASTHLNICAIYSFMGKHQQATEHAQLSIERAEKGKASKPQDKVMQESCDSVILASYYNLAVEYEHLKRYEQALQVYKKCKSRATELNRKGILDNSEEAILRVDLTIRKNKRHILEMILKKRENQEKGHYDSMRRNKKNIRNGNEEPIQSRQKKYKLYNDTSRGAQSTGKSKNSRSRPVRTNENTLNAQSSLPDIKLREINKSKPLH